MNKDAEFIALDVETANYDPGSICQIGLAHFINGELVENRGELINPETYFDDFMISIHGITAEKVRGAIKLPDLLKALRANLHDQIIVHHTYFDRLALDAAADRYGLPHIECRWLDSARVVRRVFPQFSQRGYALSNIANHLGVVYEAHDATEDAIAAGKVLIKSIERSDSTFDEWLVRAYQKTSHHQTTQIAQSGDPDGPFYGETIVFTGALSMTRQEAAQLAAKIGCNVEDDVNKRTTLLIVGTQNLDRLAGFDKSIKHRKAEALIRKGYSIQIFHERDFLQMVQLA